jgi:hypothetical protein
MSAQGRRRQLLRRATTGCVVLGAIALAATRYGAMWMWMRDEVSIKSLATHAVLSILDVVLQGAQMSRTWITERVVA